MRAPRLAESLLAAFDALEEVSGQAIGDLERELVAEANSLSRADLPLFAVGVEYVQCERGLTLLRVQKVLSDRLYKAGELS